MTTQRLDAFVNSRRYHDDGYVERDEFCFEQSDLIGCGGAARVYSGEYAGMAVAVKELVTSVTMVHRSPAPNAATLSRESEHEGAAASGVSGALAWLVGRGENAAARRLHEAEAAEEAAATRLAAQEEEEHFFQRFKSEVRIMTTLRHRYITRFYGCSLHMHHFYILMELCDCSLRHAIDYYRQDCPAPGKEQRGGQGASSSSSATTLGSSDVRGGARSWRMPLEVALEYARQVAVALCHLERKDIAHLDLKPDNCLLLMSVDSGAATARRASLASLVPSRAEFGESDAARMHTPERTRRATRARGGARSRDPRSAGGAKQKRTRSYNSECTYEVRICDFGLAQKVQMEQGAATFFGSRTMFGCGVGGGTPQYMPPELIVGVGAVVPRERLASDSSLSEDGMSRTNSIGSRASQRSFQSSDEDDRAHGDSFTAGMHTLDLDVDGQREKMKADVYAFGVILWELVTCEHVYPECRSVWEVRLASRLRLIHSSALDLALAFAVAPLLAFAFALTRLACRSHVRYCASPPCLL